MPAVSVWIHLLPIIRDDSGINYPSHNWLLSVIAKLPMIQYALLTLPMNMSLIYWILYVQDGY